MYEIKMMHGWYGMLFRVQYIRTVVNILGWAVLIVSITMILAHSPSEPGVVKGAARSVQFWVIDSCL